MIVADSPTKPRLLAGQRPPLGAYDVDIIILTLDRPSESIDAIRSALTQKGVDFHVTVLDQGSAPEMLRAIHKNFSRNENFSFYSASENLGVAGGRNIATSLGHGKIIIALDNDAVFENNWLAQNAMNIFNQSPDLGALGFNILCLDGVNPDVSSWGYPARLLPRFKHRFNTTTFVGAGHAIRRLTWDMVGGYDVEFFFTWEEYDFCLSAIFLNWRIRYDGSLTVIHKVSSQARIPWDSIRTTYFIRNRLLIARKWGASWLELTPRMSAYLIESLLHGRFRVALNGLYGAFSVKILNQRKMSSAMRKYIYQNETRHRGSWFNRFKTELFDSPRKDF